MQSKRNQIAIAFVLVAGGFLVSFWPLSVLGILFVAGMGRWVSAILLGLLLDIAYGAPIGFIHFIYFPFTLLALAAAGVRLFVLHYMRKSSNNTL